MAHKTLIGGTAYNITGGKSMVSGTVYDISKGKTMVGGTTYDINFKPEPTAMLYSDGNFVFQMGSGVESGKTLVNKYKGFEDVSYSNRNSVPWNSQLSNIKNISFKDEISPISLNYWFYGASNLISINYYNLNWNNITNMYATFQSSNLTGSPVCGQNVIDMSGAYAFCSNLTGSPVCGNKVTSMSTTYAGCSNLTGSPVCGQNVISMVWTYASCSNLTGLPVCGNKVTNMSGAYSGCSNLTGSAIGGPNVIDMSSTYASCKNIASNVYLYSSNVANMTSCFYNCTNTNKRLNIYLPINSVTQTTALYNNNSAITSDTISNSKIYPNWTNNFATNGCYSNWLFNIYIYPVENVAAARAANGD